MTNKELSVILKLVSENFNKGVEAASRGINKFSKDIYKMSTGMKRIARDISQVGNTLTMFGAAITGPLALAFKNAEKYSIPVSNEIKRMTNAVLRFQSSLASSMIPVIHQFTNVLGALVDKWSALPKSTRDSIVQTALMAGALLTLGGIVLALGGRLLTLIGNVGQLTAKFIAFAAANPATALLLVVGAVIALISYLYKLGDVVVPVLNTFELGAKVVAVAWGEAVAIMADGIANMLEKLPQVVEMIGKIPSPLGFVAKKMSQDKLQIVQDMRDVANGARKTNDDIVRNIKFLTSTGKGDLATGYEDIKKNIKDIWGILSNPPEVKIPDMIPAFNAMVQIATQTAQALQSSFSAMFFDAFTGQLKKAKDYFAEFGKQILQIMSTVLAKIFLIKMFGNIGMGSAGKLGQYFHSGGVIRAHSGLAVDEVPIIAQTGEGVLSRRGMSALGRGNFDRLNRGDGMGGGGVVINIPVVVQAWDASDVQRNEKMLVGMVGKAISNNGQLRELIRRYS